ncbi:DUF4159 domain-containing protein [Candidatus Latescibacterota bacterium]
MIISGIRKPSGIIDIKRLEKESRKFLYTGFVVAVLFHAFLGLFITYERPVIDTVEKHRSITVTLIERPPVTSEPFMIRRRRFISKDYTRSRPQARIPDGDILSRSQAPLTGEREVGTDDLDYDAQVTVDDDKPFVPDGFYLDDDGIERVPDGYISLTDEWISIDGLDTGQYMGLIVNDPADIHNIKGFIHIPKQVWGVELIPENTGEALTDLEDFVLEQYTGIKVTQDDAIYLDSPEIHNYPFLYLTAAEQFDITSHEAENLRKYITDGGFILMEPLGKPDDLDPIGMSRATNSMRRMIRDIFGRQKQTLIPHDHELFHCFFDLDLVDGYNYYQVRNYNLWQKQPLNYIEGVFIDGRLALVYSEKGYSYGWGEGGLLTARKMGVNLFVYALRHSGLGARKLVDSSTTTIQASRQGWDIESRMKHRTTERSSYNKDFVTKRGSQ